MRYRWRLAVVPFLSLAGCKDKVTVYRAPKEAPASFARDSPSPELPMGNLSGGVSSASDGANEAATNAVALKWTTPANWNSLGPSGMRLASFVIKGHSKEEADISVVVFPGSAGGLLANVNRWRGQIRLPPFQEPELAKNSERISSPAGEMALFDFVSAEPINGAREKTRVLGAIWESPSQSWFFKMSGRDPVVAAAKSDFRDLLKSLRPNG